MTDDETRDESSDFTIHRPGYAPAEGSDNREAAAEGGSVQGASSPGDRSGDELDAAEEGLEK